MISWETCRKEFEWDGSLRDIYVQTTTIRDWQILVDKLATSYKISFQIDGAARPLPATMAEVFAIRDKASTLLNVEAGNILAACHFFTPDEIEFDIDPRQVASQTELDSLLEFLRFIGDCVNKPVMLTLENGIADPILMYEPHSKCFRP
jgi:hypothetical protein